MLLSFCRSIVKTPNSSLLRLALVYKSLYTQSGQTEDPPNSKQDDQDQAGTEYSNWVLARSAKLNHDVSYLKRRFGRDRYNIHKLTNMDFMCSLITRDDKYTLNLNENIVLLAQMNHICNVLKKDKCIYNEFSKLTTKIEEGLHDPPDYICIGTFINTLVDQGNFNQPLWIHIMDTLFARKYDEQYDELFGLYVGLYKYKLAVEDICDYIALQRNKIIYNIPIIYRNSLETIRQYVRYNTYNLKECRLLFHALHKCGMNQKYFWKSTNDWFNIYIKEQLQSKDFQEYFIVAESAIQKVLFDDGMIRPRSVLEEVAEIAFVLSEYGFISHRFLSFIERLIIYSIERGSQLFIQFLEIEKSENSVKEEKKELNQHIRINRSKQKQKLEQMQKSYRTIFVNPTEVNSEAVIHILVVLKRALTKKQDTAKEQTQTESNTKGNKQSLAVDGRVLSWLVVRLCQSKMKYTVNQLLKIIDSRNLLSSLRIDIRRLVLEKIKDVRQKHCSLHDLTEIFRFLPLMEFESISYILEDFLLTAHPKDIILLTQLFERESMSPEDTQIIGIEPTKREADSSRPEDESQMDRSHLSAKQKNKRWIPYLVKYFMQLPKTVNYHQNYYSFDENCYFFYLLLKNQQYWQVYTEYQYQGQMQRLKVSIKIASYNRGFKIQMGSYFYKILNYVDLASFFQGG